MDQLTTFYVINKSVGGIGTRRYKNRAIFAQGFIGQETGDQGIIPVLIHQHHLEQVHIGITQQLMNRLPQSTIVRQFEEDLPLDPVGPHLPGFGTDKKPDQKAKQDDNDNSEKNYHARKPESRIRIGIPKKQN